MATNSQPEFSNSFGTVHSNRIVFKAKKHWWAGGSHEELPLRHVTSIRIETSRSILLGVILVLAGMAVMSIGEPAAVVIGAISLLFGIVLIIGHPSVRINTAGQDMRTIAGSPGSKSEATRFINAVRERLFEES